MKKVLVSLVSISALSIGVACAAPKPYSGFVVFGDSLVDAGQYRRYECSRSNQALHQ